MREAVLGAPGATDPGERARVAAGEAVPGPLGDYLAKIRNASYKIVDSDVDSLRGLGLTEDAIFELTLSAALGEADRRRSAALRALRRGSGG